MAHPHHSWHTLPIITSFRQRIPAMSSTHGPLTVKASESERERERERKKGKAEAAYLRRCWLWARRPWPVASAWRRARWARRPALASCWPLWRAPALGASSPAARPNCTRSTCRSLAAATTTGLRWRSLLRPRSTSAGCACSCGCFSRPSLAAFF